MPWEPLIQNPASNSDRVYPTSRALSRLFADIAKMSCCSREPAQNPRPRFKALATKRLSCSWWRSAG